MNSCDGKRICCGRLYFVDPLRKDASRFVSVLQKDLGLRVILASGDASPALESIAKAVGLASQSVDVSLSSAHKNVSQWCHCLPVEKADLIKQLKSKGEKVVMIGDGMNDAAALAVADVAIAVGSNDLVASVSDVVVGGDGPAELRKVVQLFRFSRSTLHVARRGVIGGMAISFIQMVCAATGFLPPFANAVLQECVDLGTVTHAMLSQSKFA